MLATPSFYLYFLLFMNTVLSIETLKTVIKEILLNQETLAEDYKYKKVYKWRTKNGHRYGFDKNGNPVTIGAQKAKNAQNTQDNYVPKKTVTKLKIAFDKILKGEKSIVVKNVRSDLEKLGGTNDILIERGARGKSGLGLEHIIEEHQHKTLRPVIDAIVYGQIARYVKDNKRVFLQHNGHEAVLCLTKFGERQTWLLTGYKIDPKYEKER